MTSFCVTLRRRRLLLIRCCCCCGCAKSTHRIPNAYATTRNSNVNARARAVRIHNLISINACACPDHASAINHTQARCGRTRTHAIGLGVSIKRYYGRVQRLTEGSKHNAHSSSNANNSDGGMHRINIAQS